MKQGSRLFVYFSSCFRLWTIDYPVLINKIINWVLIFVWLPFTAAQKRDYIIAASPCGSLTFAFSLSLKHFLFLSHKILQLFLLMLINKIHMTIRSNMMVPPKYRKLNGFNYIKISTNRLIRCFTFSLSNLGSITYIQHVLNFLLRLCLFFSYTIITFT